MGFGSPDAMPPADIPQEKITPPGIHEEDTTIRPKNAQEFLDTQLELKEKQDFGNKFIAKFPERAKEIANPDNIKILSLGDNIKVFVIVGENGVIGAFDKEVNILTLEVAPFTQEENEFDKFNKFLLKIKDKLVAIITEKGVLAVDVEGIDLNCRMNRLIKLKKKIFLDRDSNGFIYLRDENNNINYNQDSRELLEHLLIIYLNKDLI